MEKQIAELAKALVAVRTAMELEEIEGAEDCVNAIGAAEDAILKAMEAVLHCGRTYPSKS
jgi:precorrin isomerase